MREIKFRVFDKKCKKMRKVQTWFDVGTKRTTEHVKISGLHGFHGVRKKRFSEIMQYTGLKDKNGKEIYEGDIVDAWSEGMNAKCEIKWGQGSARFFLYRKCGGICWNLSGGHPNYTQETVEVIGDIYTTPELLTNN